jgi:hypothetical protein
LQGEPILLADKFRIISRLWEEFSLLKEQGRFWELQGEEQRGIANWQGLARADEQGAELRAQSRRPRRACPDSGLIKRCASTEVAGIDPAVGAFQVLHGFEPATARVARWPPGEPAHQ